MATPETALAEIEGLLRGRDAAVANQDLGEAERIVVEYHKLLHVHVEELISDSRELTTTLTELQAARRQLAKVGELAEEWEKPASMYVTVNQTRKACAARLRQLGESR